MPAPISGPAAGGEAIMDIYGYISAIAVFVYACIFLTFLASKKNAVIRQFLVLLAAMFFWCGGSLLMRWMTAPSYIFWYHVSLGGLLLTVYSYYRFMTAFAEKEDKLFSIIGFVALAGVFVLNLPSGILLRWPEPVQVGSDIEFQYEMRWPVAVLFILAALVIVRGVCNLIAAYREKPHYRAQFRPVLQGIFVMFLGHALLLLPFFSGFPVDILSGIANACLLVYALVRKRLFRLQLLASESVCYLIGLGVTFLLFMNIQPYWMRLIDHLPDVLAERGVLIFAVFFVLTVILLAYTWKKLVNNVLIKDEAQQAEVLREYTLTVSQLLNVDDILEKTVSTLKKVDAVGSVYVCVLQETTGDYKACYSDQPLHELSFSIQHGNPLLQMLRRESCISWHTFENSVAYKSVWQSEKDRFRSLNIFGCLGLLGDEGVMPGVVLFSQRQGKHIRMHDLQWMQSVASVTSIALKNARMYEHACHEARTDELTGLYNRKYFYELLDQQFELAREGTLSLILINIDDFKLYNQLYGAKEGDRALWDVARVLQHSVGANGYVARYSSKEFAVLLPRYDVLAARTLAESIRDQVMNMNRRTVDRKLKVLTLSIGISTAPFDAATSKQLLENADMAVYRVKRSGKNGISIFDSTLRTDRTRWDKVDHRHIYQEYEPTVVALTAAIDAKDHYTFSHSQNVAYYSTELAMALKLNNDFVEIIRQAALLHDIGKISIPESILNKEGKLTSEEYEIMQGHVESSIGIIRHLPSLDYIIPAVIGHHERYDGKGYPRRIGGEDIPLPARILCLADSFDAMTSKRCYKAALTWERAIEILREEAGRQFDPKLVPIFIRCLEDGTIRMPSTRPLPAASESELPVPAAAGMPG